MSLTWQDGAPAVGEYLELMRLAGEGRRAPSAAAKGIEGSLHVVAARRRGRLVGLGRLVGDGGTVAQIVDVAVDPEMRGQGLGTGLVERLIAWAETELPATCRIVLIAPPGSAAFYKRFGFEIRTGMERILT